MKTSTKIIIGIIGIGIVATGSYLWSQVQKIINAPFAVKGVKDLDLTGGEIKFTLVTQITNDSSISAYVKNQYYEVFLGNKLVSKIENKEEIFVGAAHKFDKEGNQKPNEAKIPLKVDINKKALTDALLSNLTNIVADKSKVKLSLKGYFNWKAGIVSAKQDFNLDFTLKEIIDMNKKS